MNYAPPQGPTNASVSVSSTAAVRPAVANILTTPALAFIVDLERRFGLTRRSLLAARREVQARLDDGWRPDFPAETRKIRESDWRVALAPADLQDRRVEITGPVDRKMLINGLNAGANVFMADFEDSTAPTWENIVAGQQNVKDAVAGSISFDDPIRGKSYRLIGKPAVLIVRPRGWHLEEAHVVVDGSAMSASLCDFGLFAFHNAAALLAKGTGVYVYLPKLESRHEAALWREVFAYTEQQLGLPSRTIRATVLIETILAAFEMDEILYELRDYIVGLNCGRWDYIFSFIKKFRNRADCVLPDRGSVTMETHALRNYSRLLIETCHRRGAHAMGGMAAQIPIKNDPTANAAALAKVMRDKEREANDGHDGTWVAHPDLVGIARQVFDARMPDRNQIGRTTHHPIPTAADLLAIPPGSATEAGLRQNVRVGLLYLAAWLRGAGCVPIDHLMEDAATAEISRAQVWQWARHHVRLDGGRTVDAELVRAVLGNTVTTLVDGGQDAAALAEASELFEEVALAPNFADFLTLPAYRRLLASETRSQKDAAS